MYETGRGPERSCCKPLVARKRITSVQPKKMRPAVGLEEGVDHLQMLCSCQSRRAQQHDKIPKQSKADVARE